MPELAHSEDEIKIISSDVSSGKVLVTFSDETFAAFTPGELISLRPKRIPAANDSD
jgi:hypothetical protein